MTEENNKCVVEIGDFVSTPFGETYDYHQWFENYWASLSFPVCDLIDQDLEKWNGKFFRSTGREFIRFEREQDFTLFLLRWS